MRYKTTIEVLTEAENKYEAADIAGAFLKGEINTGADLKVDTISLTKSRTLKAVLVICLAITISGGWLAGNQIYYKFVKVEKKPVTAYAIQPPIKTNLRETQSQEFKNIWQKAHKDRLNSIAR